MISKVRKRDGRIEDFRPDKVTTAIQKALKATKKHDGRLAKQLSEDVVKILEQQYSGKIPSVEIIQDIVEDVLIKNKLAKTAKAYILYRSQRAKIREFKEFLV